MARHCKVPGYYPPEQRDKLVHIEKSLRRMINRTSTKLAKKMASSMLEGLMGSTMVADISQRSSQEIEIFIAQISLELNKCIKKQLSNMEQAAKEMKMDLT